MYAVTVDVGVDLNREEEARKMLREMVVPAAKARAGFAESARAAAEQIQSKGPPPGAPVTLKSVNTYEVLAQA